MTDVDAIKAVDDILAQLDDAARQRVLVWAWGKHAAGAPPTAASRVRRKKGSRAPKQNQKGTSKVVPKASQRPSIVKDLNLRPQGKKAFRSFAEQKAPSSVREKCTVAVYYLTSELELHAITVDHVYTCYKEVKWRVPVDLKNNLAQTAFHTGWIDSSDMNDIKITTRGENLVEQDLPTKTKEKAK